VSRMDDWFRKHDPRRRAEEVLRKQRLAEVEDLHKRQQAGEISEWQASEEFDMMLMRDDPEGRLIYYSDSTGLTAEWDPDVMLFPAPGSTQTNRLPSNTGIYARGPKRGWFITHPAGETPTCLPDLIDHFKPGSKGWIGGPPNSANAEPTEATPNAGGKKE
jgi:hypothetical protein